MRICAPCTTASFSHRTLYCKRTGNRCRYVEPRVSDAMHHRATWSRCTVMRDFRCRYEPSRFWRFVIHANTCAVTRGDWIPSRSGTLYLRLRIFSCDSGAHRCAPVEADAFPGRLRCRWQPSFNQRNTASERPPADLPAAIFRTPRSANARGVTAGSICTIATRDSFHHRVQCPCAGYHRVLTRHRAALRFREHSAA